MRFGEPSQHALVAIQRSRGLGRCDNPSDQTVVGSNPAGPTFAAGFNLRSMVQKSQRISQVFLYPLYYCEIKMGVL